MTEHERAMEERNRAIKQDIIRKLESHFQTSGTILQNQGELKDSQKSLSGLLTQVKQEISELIEAQKAMRKSQKRLQEIWIITFLTIAIPISTFWVAWMVYWVVK